MNWPQSMGSIKIPINVIAQAVVEHLDLISCLTKSPDHRPKTGKLILKLLLQEKCILLSW